MQLRGEAMIDWTQSEVSFIFYCRCGAAGSITDFDGDYIECHACHTMYKLPHLLLCDRAIGAVPGGEMSIVTDPMTTCLDTDDISFI